MGKFRSVQKVRNISKSLKIVDIPWQEAFQQFLGWKRAQNLSKASLDKYDQMVNLFFKRFPDAFLPGNLKEAVYKHMAQDMSPTSYNHRLIYLGSFLKWCVDEFIIPENPLKNFSTKQVDDKIIDVDDETLKKLLKLPDRTTFAGLRDYALMCLFLDTGIRPGEASQLLKEDINFESLEIYIRTEVAKTRVKRTLPILPETAKLIRKIIALHHPSWKGSCPVFCTCEGSMLNRYTGAERVREYGLQLGIHITPYSFRHIFALHYLRNGGDALHLKRLLGHKTLLMTNKYVALTSNDLKQQHSIASPLNTLLPQKHRMRKV
jgi:site-specific recombinase XerD